MAPEALELEVETCKERLERAAILLGQDTSRGYTCAAIKEFFPGSVEWEKPEGGLNVWAGLPRSSNTVMKSGFFRRALEQDVLYVPGNLCYADDPTRRKPSHEMRLSFGAAPEADIRRGIRRLGRVIGKN